MCAQKITLTVISEDLLTIVQAAKELGVHPATAYRWVENRLLHTFRISDQIFVTVDEVNSVKKRIATGELPTDKRGLRRGQAKKNLATAEAGK